MDRAFRCENINVGYGKRIIAEGITAELFGGEILAVIGPNGAGKSTFLKSLTGELKLLGGAVYIGEDSLKNIGIKELAKRQSFVSTQKSFGEYMRVYEMIAAGRYPYTGIMGGLSEKDDEEVKYAASLAGLTELLMEPFDSLSDGQKQRVIIARALCQEPEVLLLDEPTSFLDIKYRFEILTLIRKLAVEKNICVIMSMHELDMARRFSDKVLALKAGKADKLGTAEEVLTDEYICRLFDMDYKTAKSSLTCRVKRRKKARVIMIQGTMSGVGKSLVAAGLCRVFKQDGYKVCPFKSQNMSLNSYITDEGLEMGRAQVMQARSAGITPSADMNPILLKPTTDIGSQVIVNGKSIGNMSAKEYFAYKKELMPVITGAFTRLEDEYDIVVIEGAGSPAEINLRENDIVNMGLATELDAPVIIVGDIDRGGVFAQLTGTVNLLKEDEKSRVEGFIINKFRGDKTLLYPGIDMLKDLSGIDTLGLMPYENLSLDDEDSLSDRFLYAGGGIIDVAVIRFPKISNFTDLHPFEMIDGVGVRYVSDRAELKNPDFIILPGSKSTIADLEWMRNAGLADEIIKKTGEGVPVMGICGGYQMLCESIDDRNEAENGGTAEGLRLLNGDVIFDKNKETKQTEAVVNNIGGVFSVLNGRKIKGYEIHMGKVPGLDAPIVSNGNVYGTFIHGFFDNGDVAFLAAEALAERKGVKLKNGGESFESLMEKEYDRLADITRQSLDMPRIYEIMEKYYDN